MSQISKALKKIQDLRQDHQGPKPENIVYLTDAPKVGPRTTWMVIFALSTASSILISITAIIITLNNSESKQVQVVNLENTVKSQEKRINDFITAINKNQKISDSQIRDLNIRLKNASKDTQVEINSLASSESAHYDSTKEAIIDAKQRLDSLDNYIKSLDQKVQTISVANTQVKDTTSPVTGN